MKDMGIKKQIIKWISPLYYRNIYYLFIINNFNTLLLNLKASKYS